MNSKEWRKLNPERWKMHQKNYRLRQPVICRQCGEIILNHLRKSGRTLHPWCVTLRRHEVQRTFRVKVFHQFLKMKEAIGCQICGYNIYGGSLDWHHLFGKDRRITAKMWFSNTETIKFEIEKCVLLCKNHHYEVIHD